METTNDIIVKEFVFNPFQENTYLVYDNSGEAIIIDPGHSRKGEREKLSGYISANGLKLAAMVFSHGHLDHVWGAAYIKEKYGLSPLCHTDEIDLLKDAVAHGKIFGFDVDQPPLPAEYLGEGDRVEFGGSSLQVFHAPGHSPGHIILYSESGKFVITGDVLFRGSIGRTDLPGGDYNTLIKSIQTKIFKLPDDTIVYSGHGPSTTVGNERRTNPFLS